MNLKFSFLLLVGFSLAFLACLDPNAPTVPTVTSVNVYCEAESQGVVKGETVQFIAEVTGTNNPAQTVTWSIVQKNKSSGTYINKKGLLFVADDEVLESLTVKATSTVDTAKSGITAIKVIEPNGSGTNNLTGTVIITGDAQEGHTLTANTGSLDGSGTVTYQWKRGDTAANVNTNIGSNSNTYAAAAADIGKYINVTVTRDGYSGSITSSNTVGPVIAASAPTPTVSSVTVSPASASVVKGETQAFTAAVAGTNNPAQTVTWSVEEPHASGTGINADGALTVAAEETATTLTIRATSTVDITKSGTSTVSVMNPVLTGTVIITGDAQEGHTLTANTDSLDGSGTVTYQWKRGDTRENVNTDIGENSDTYVAAAADIGKYITVTVIRNGYEGSIRSEAVGPVIAAAAPTPTVSSVTVDPSTASLLIGETLQFTAEVKGTHEPAQTVTWAIVETHAAETGIVDGILTIAADETAESLTVRATSTVDPDKSGEADVTVLHPTVTSVTVSPADINVNKGETQKFTATVTKENDPKQTITDDVTWTVTGGINGTSIADDGTLTVAFGQTANLTVKAASKFDTGKFGTASVTISTPPLTGTVTITGIVQEEQTLTANTGNLIGDGNGTVTYQWMRGETATGAFTNISGAASSTYTLVTADLNKYIKLTVTRNGYTGSITSDAVGPVKAKTVPIPTVTSVTISPTTETVLKGATKKFTATVTGNNSPAQTVSWTVTGGVTGTGIANDGTLTVSANETAATLTVKAASTIDTTKSATAAVTVPALTGTVSITGTAQVGQDLTANTSSLQGSGTISYQWLRGDTAAAAGTNISGAASSTYKLVTADQGKFIKVTVTRAGYRESVTSSATAQITFPALSGTVTINGTAQVGQTLTANTTSLGGSGGTIGYQWTSSNTSNGTFANISGATSSTYTLVSGDLNKYIKVTVTRTGYSGSVTSAATAQITQQQQAAEVIKSTNTGSTAFNGLTTPASSYDVVDLPPESKTDVMKVSPTDSNWAVAQYSLSAYKGKEIKITLSVNVKRTGAAGTLMWQINNSDYPAVATVSNAATGTWHSMSGTWTGTPSGEYPALYLNNDKSTPSSTYYIDNFTITITETSSGGGGGGDGPPTITTTPLDKNAAGVQTFTSNSGGNKALSGSPYGYEMWTEGGNNNKLIWFGPNQGGGAAFRAEWNNPNDFLGRVGYFWNQGKPFTDYKNIYCDFNYTRSGRSTAGNYSYIGIYGWSRNPSAAKEEEKLIEYYIVDDWFGNSSQSDTSPMGTGTTGGSEVGSYTLDGATYKVIKNVRVNKPSIDGDKTFTQFFSIRQTLRKTGTISVTKHFQEWDKLNMKLGSNMYECKFLVEAGGGTGWLEFTYLKFSQEENPR
ncbi:MAG: glycoside hydrolase family 11 protein [Treponema sp.]|jgi:hypothetical protein|nr:glycoside hydrolase family 11 protein [Treponema sp.]